MDWLYEEGFGVSMEDGMRMLIDSLSQPWRHTSAVAQQMKIKQLD